MMSPHRFLLILLTGIAGMIATSCHGQEPDVVLPQSPFTVIASPDNRLSFFILSAKKQIATFSLGGWGPNWGWTSVESKDWGAKGGMLEAKFPFVVDEAKGQRIDGIFTAQKRNAQSLLFQIDLTAKTDVPLTMLKASLTPAGIIDSGADAPKLSLTLADGTVIPMTYPFGIRPASPPVREMSYVLGGKEIKLSLQPPLPVAFDNEPRIQLATDKFVAGNRRIRIIVSFPDTTEFLASESDIKTLAVPVATGDWYPFTPTDSVAPSVLSVDDWLEKPAGRRGGVRMVGDHFQFTDGSPVKFWGVNLSYGDNCAPARKDADFTASRFARFGVNGVRLHKFTYPKSVDNGIGDPNDATKMTPDGLDRLDYFSNELKKRGIYFGWSHTFGFRPRPANKPRLLAYDEIEKNLGGNTYALINFAEDVQDLLIEMTVNLLNHKNPHTGLPYSREPALSFIELQNEDDIFFYTTESVYQKCPTYAKKLRQRFAAWLRGQYVTPTQWREAWGSQIQNGESLTGEVNVQPNPWFYSSGSLQGKSGAERQRLLDNASFFHAIQNKFYSRYVKAIRDTGYEGPICGSPWQAPAMLPHYLNLRSDALAGYIDRHDYFGGGLNDTLMGNPGGGYLSTGLQQVSGRPFGLSEWIHVYPSLYSAEGPPLIAAYGMGLQGWDASYQFQSVSASRSFHTIAGNLPWGVWEADTPTQLGQYPILSRMVLRGDVQEGSVTSIRVVNLADMAKGIFPFTDTIEQQGDIKKFGGTVPSSQLAYGRALVEFTDKPAPPRAVVRDAGRGEGEKITSVTKQLNWEVTGRDRGFVTIDTPGTQGVVGFAPDKTISLNEITVKMQSGYASLLITARGKSEKLATAKSALISAMARSSNTGFTTFAVDNRILENGKSPILLEPVKATITLSKRKIKTVYLLDHDGKRTDKVLPASEGKIVLDGAKDKTPYYEVVFAD